MYARKKPLLLCVLCGQEGCSISPVEKNCVHTKPCGSNYLNKLSEGLNLRDLESSGVEPEVIIADGWLIGPTGPELYTRNSGVAATLLPHPGTISSAG
jgi:hypothetical protein